MLCSYGVDRSGQELSPYPPETKSNNITPKKARRKQADQYSKLLYTDKSSKQAVDCDSSF